MNARDSERGKDVLNIVIGTNQFVTTNNYDAGGKLQSVNLPGSRNISYTYDANGNIETITEAGKTIKYYYNELNELTREDNQVLDKTVAYLYDAGGNILSKKDYAYTTDANLSNPVNTISYTYGDANWKDKLTAYNGKTITYDNIGNPLTYDGYTYTWEEGRQLKTISGNGLDISFKYNSGGIRTEKKVGNIITKYHLIGDKVTFEDNGTDKIYYTYGNDGNLVSMNLNGVEYYYIRNAQGDIVGLLDGNGTEVVSYVYDSWGKLVSTSGALKDTVGVKNPYRYRGYRYDIETELYCLQSRYYNPEWGRFINADDLLGVQGDLLTHNMFTYCLNNPVNMEDPSGKLGFPSLLKLQESFMATMLVVFTYLTVVTMPASVRDKMFSNTSSSTKERAATDSLVLEKTKKDKKDTVIYRTGSGNGTNLTPRKVDTNGLSYTTIKPNPPYTQTTIKTVNATKVLLATPDPKNPTHILVNPTNPLTMPGWINSRDNANNYPHPYTVILQNISQKVR